MRRLKKWWHLPFHLKWMLIEVLFLSAYYRMKLLYFPFAKLSDKIGTLGFETEKEAQNETICMECAWATDVICKRTPWESKCLVRALTAKKLLNQRKLPCTLYMGVLLNQQGDMTAHAWLRCGEIYVSGGNGEGTYTITAVYGDRNTVNSKMFL